MPLPHPIEFKIEHNPSLPGTFLSATGFSGYLVQNTRKEAGFLELV